VHYVSGFVGICLIQYFHRRHVDSAFAVLLRLLNWNVVFTQTVCGLLKVMDVIEMATKVSCDLVSRFICISSSLL